MKKQGVLPVLTFMLATILLLVSVFVIYYFMQTAIDQLVERAANSFPQSSIATR